MLEMHPWRDAVITIGVGRLHCFLDHLLRLDPQERLLRFCHPADDACLREYVAHLDLKHHKIVGCFDGGQMRGAAELRAAGTAPSGPVEAAFSLEKDWRGKGIERALILRALSTARSMGARHLVLNHLGCSEALRRTLAQFAAEMVFGDDDCSAWLALAASGAELDPDRPAPGEARLVHPLHSTWCWSEERRCPRKGAGKRSNSR